LKRLLIALFALVASGGAFALDVSTGVSVSGGFFINWMTTSNSSLGVSSLLMNTSVPFHGEVYVDMQYAQFGVGYRLNVLGHRNETQTTSGSTTTVLDQNMGTKGYAAFTFYAKYPFTIGQYVLQPLLGFEYDVNTFISGSSDNPDNQFWIKAGMGAQLPLSDWGYIRAHLLFGWKIPSQAESDAVANATTSGFDASLYTLDPEIGFAVGFKL
jgi:hypothetical protein